MLSSRSTKCQGCGTHGLAGLFPAQDLSKIEPARSVSISAEGVERREERRGEGRRERERASIKGEKGV